MSDTTSPMRRLDKLRSLPLSDPGTVEEAALIYGQIQDERDAAFRRIRDLDVDAEAHMLSTHWVNEMTGVASGQVSKWRRQREKDGASPKRSTVMSMASLDKEMADAGLRYQRARDELEMARQELARRLSDYDGPLRPIARLAGVSPPSITRWQEEGRGR